MVGHGSRILERAAILEVGRNPGGPEAVVADPGADASRERAPLHHEIGIGLGQGSAAQPPSAATNGPEQRPLRVLVDPSLLQIGMQVGLERMVARHLVLLAAFLPQPDPQSSALHEDILDPHGQRRPDPREAVDHERDQRPGHAARSGLKRRCCRVTAGPRADPAPVSYPCARCARARALRLLGWSGSPGR